MSDQDGINLLLTTLPATSHGGREHQISLWYDPTTQIGRLHDHQETIRFARVVNVTYTTTNSGEREHRQVVDVEPLVALPALRSLVLRGNPLEDIAPLAHLPALEYLDVGRCHITTIAALSGAPRLATLWANGNPLGDFAELRLARAHYLFVDRSLVLQSAVDAFLQHHPRASVDRY